MTPTDRVGTIGGMTTPLVAGTLGALVASLSLLAAPFTDTSTDPTAGPSTSSGVGSSVPEADWPVSPGEVVTPFDDPLPYGAGHRGLDLAATPGQTVIAALPGRVSVAGYVAGRPLVVIQHENDIRTTYLPVLASVSVGDQVRAGEAIGVVGGELSGSAGVVEQHCLASPCLHWGARRGETYIDPHNLMSSVARPTGPIVLLPEP